MLEVFAAGSRKRKAEWKYFLTYAANRVFFWDPHYDVGLDAPPVPADDCLPYFQRGTPEARFAGCLGQMQSFIESGRWYFWDPMAAAIMLDESLANFEEQPIYVVEEPGKELGATIVFPGAPPIRVAVSADGERFSQDFIQTLNNQ